MFLAKVTVDFALNGVSYKKDDKILSKDGHFYPQLKAKYLTIEAQGKIEGLEESFVKVDEKNEVHSKLILSLQEVSKPADHLKNAKETIDTLKKENEKLTKERDSLKKVNEGLEKDLKDLKKSK